MNCGDFLQNQLVFAQEALKYWKWDLLFRKKIYEVDIFNNNNLKAVFKVLCIHLLI